MAPDGSRHALNGLATGFLIGLAAILIALVPLGLLAMPTSRTVAVLGSPGQNMAALVAGAGGSILSMGGWSNIIVATDGPPDLVARLYASGAWLVIDASEARGCAPVSRAPAPRAQAPRVPASPIPDSEAPTSEAPTWRAPLTQAQRI